MDDPINDVEPQVVDDLRVVEQACQVLGACGTRAEFWEVFTLLKIGREGFQAETDRLGEIRKKGGSAKVDAALVEKLSKIKAELSPIARKLREFLSKSPSGILDGMKQDLALVFLMGSAKARASVTKWLADPTATAADSALKLKILSRLVDAYRKVLLEARKYTTPIQAPDTTVRSMSPAAPKIKPEFVDDLRYIERGRRLFPAEVSPSWEIICLMLAQRDDTRRAIDELEFLKTKGKPGEFAGASYRFRTLVKEVRTQHDPLAGPVRAYLKTIFGTYTGEADELALAFLVASSQGRHRAKQWLDDPDLCRGEASASMNGLRARAAAYLDAVKSQPVA